MFITFMWGIYSCTPETNHVSRVYSVAAFLYLQFIACMLFPLLNVLYFYISTFRSMCAVRNVFFSSLISCFPGTLLGYYLHDL
jgi:hypothetical protein